MDNTFVRPVAILIFALTLSCCGDGGIRNGADNSVAGADSGSADLPQRKMDSVKIDLAKSSVACIRNKAVKSYDKKMKLFGAEVNVKMDDASFTANTNLEIKDAYWLLSDGNLERGVVVIDMKSVAALKIAEDERVEIGSPDYLEAKKYPTSKLTIKGFKQDPIGSKQSVVEASLQIKDTVGDIEFPVEMLIEGKRAFDYPDRLTGEFTIDGTKWGLNPKDAKVIKDELTFKIILSKQALR